MPETPSFVVNDRRKFTSEGELRHDTPLTESAGTSSPSGEQPLETTSAPAQGGPQFVASGTAPNAELADLPETSVLDSLSAEAVSDSASLLGDSDQVLDGDEFIDDALPPGPTDEQSAEATRAYDATVDRLDTALRAADPGGERMPEMSFERLTQSLYTQALLLLGGGAQPGETPRVDILGARQTIDMIAIIAEKTKGNLTPDEDKLLQSALFDLRMGFLEITQALARQAAQRQGSAPGGAGGFGGANPGAGPRIVR